LITKYEPTKLYYKVIENLAHINLLRGGARSSKTNSLLAMSVRWLWTGYIGDQHIPTGEAIILRETMPALKRTVMREFIDMLHLQGIINFIDWRKSTFEFFYQGRRIAFMPMDDESKVLGMQPVWFWINEGNKAPFNIFSQLILRTENMCFLDYNPFDMYGWINQELEIKRSQVIKDVALTVSTYRDNPHLPEVIIKEIESLKLLDKDLYKVYNTGQWVAMRGLVYTQYTTIDELPEGGKRVIGMDFGFTHHSAMCMVVIDGDNMYLEELFFERENLTSDLIAYCRENEITGLIIADESRPEAIREMKLAGLWVKKSKKGADSVKQGINNMKLYKMHVTKGSVNLLKELNQYKWAELPDGTPKEEPVKAFDDLLDAARYANTYLHKGSRKIRFL